MTGQIRAIFWAQWKTLVHFRRGDGFGGSVLSGLVLLIWYGLWVTLAVLAAVLASEPDSRAFLETLLARALMFVVFYWQLAPVLMASLGASLDLKKLLVYPIPPGQLFGVELLLRLSTCLEMVLLVTGLAAGLARNPAVPGKAAPAALFLFVSFNLLLASGLRHQIERLMARRRLRELLVILLVMAAALPQLLLAMGLPAPLGRALAAISGPWWPWELTARLALGHPSVAGWLAALFWTAAAWVFGRWQFSRSLRLDAAARDVKDGLPARPDSRLDAVYRLPAKCLSDPLAVIVEKELRSLVRSPRFRLVFVMGFTFGVVLFLPFVLRNRVSSGGGLPAYFLTLMCVYALLLLGDTIFWNIFGFDRAATRLYFLEPFPFSVVLIGKNLAAVIFVLLEVTAVAAVWKLFRMPADFAGIVEAYAVPLVLCIYLLAAGNLASVCYPRPVSPDRSTGASSSARIRILLLLAYPVLSIPVLLAYGARYAFRSQTAFYGVLIFAAALGAALYWAALGTATAKSDRDKEKFLETLSQSEGPISLV
jgi:ABC-2 type transport system permease protein